MRNLIEVTFMSLNGVMDAPKLVLQRFQGHRLAAARMLH